jgi:hypothetical protein
MPQPHPPVSTVPLPAYKRVGRPQGAPSGPISISHLYLPGDYKDIQGAIASLAAAVADAVERAQTEHHRGKLAEGRMAAEEIVELARIEERLRKPEAERTEM